MKYKKGDKFIIEIADEIQGHNNNEGPSSDPAVYYRIKGFNTLFFDDSGLNKLKKFKDEDEEIRVGDEVIVAGYGGSGVVTYIDCDDICVMFFLGGSAYTVADKIKKTGRHFDEINTVLRRLKRGDE